MKPGISAVITQTTEVDNFEANDSGEEDHDCAVQYDRKWYFILNRVRCHKLKSAFIYSTHINTQVIYFSKVKKTEVEQWIMTAVNHRLPGETWHMSFRQGGNWFLWDTWQGVSGKVRRGYQTCSSSDHQTENTSLSSISRDIHHFINITGEVEETFWFDHEGSGVYEY